MLARNKTLRYIGIPVGLALLLLAGGIWGATPVSRAGEASGSYDADSHSDIWASPMYPNPGFKMPWDASWNWPRDESRDSLLRLAAIEQQRVPVNSDSAQMRTIEALKRDGIGFLTASGLQDKMKSSWHGIVIEVGAKSAYMHEHILGAINIPENQIGTLAPIVLPDPQVPIVTYCGSTECTASMSAAKQFKALGYAEVYDFWGGLKTWVVMGLPTRGSEVAGK
jgi:rhodanese-related sulfurtransferase